MFSRVEMLDIRNRMKNSSYVDDDFFHTFIKDGYVGLFFPRIEDGKEENKEDVESDLSNELDELIEHKWDRVEFVFDWNNIRIFEKNEFEPYWNLFISDGYKVTKLDPNKKGTYILVSLE